MPARLCWSVGLSVLLVAVCVPVVLPPAAAQPSKLTPAGMELVPTEGFAVVTVNVAKLYDSDATKPLRTAFEKGDRAFLKRIETDTGFSPEQVDRVTAYLPTATFPLTESPLLFLTLRKPFDKAKLLQTLNATTDPPVHHNHEEIMVGIAGGPPGGPPIPIPVPDPAKPKDDKPKEKKPLDPNAPLYYVGKAGESVLIPLDDRTVVLLPYQSSSAGSPALVATLLRRKADGPLADAVALADKHHAVLSVTGKQLREWVKVYREFEAAPTLPMFDMDGNPVVPMKPMRDPDAEDELSPFEPLAECERATVTLDVGDKTTLRLTAVFNSSEAARKGEGAVKAGMQALTKLLTTGKEEAGAGGDADLIPAYDFALGGLAKAATTVDGKTLTATATADVGAALKTAMLTFPDRIQAAADRIRTQNNLIQLGLAIQNYEAANSSLPQDITDSDGKVLLSWRVQLLPYLEANDLFTEIDRSKSWDDPANKKLWDKMPDVFKVAGRNAPAKSDTFFQTFRAVNWVGSNDAWMVDTKKVTTAEVTDGTSQTLAVVEAEGAVNWMKPDDLLFDPKKLPAIGDPKTGKANVVMLDGSAHVLDREKFSGDKLKALVTVNGGEDVDLGK
jgi:hypothetical protein